MKAILSFLFVALLLSSALLTTAAEVDDELAQQLAGKNSTEFVKVWLKLHDREKTSAIKNAAELSAPDFAGRYRIVTERLRRNNQSSQTDLLTWLKPLEQTGKARSVKGHWLVNIVEAEIQIDLIDQLSRRNDIEIITAVPQVASIETVETKAAPPMAAAIGNNLTAIKADQAWAAGYTGAGRIVCSFDTGVDGAHPALFDNWKGNDGNAAAAWFDPSGMSTFPERLSTNHGTYSMGCIVGHDDNTGDTVGVALDAKWISAAVMDVEGASLLDGFEWAVDPDRDPNTISDVPDVINHSWGVIGIGCPNVFFDLIDNVEALGIVNIFAAGNEGATASSIRNPANRALTNIDCFAVGNVSTSVNPPVVAISSSRGPSDCNGAIKPNVCAPGSMVRTTNVGTTYALVTGTSFSAPHVSGLVALMRQKNPNATVDQIKTAILNTTQKYSYILPDNDYGWGVVDCMAAINAVSSVNPNPNFRTFSFDHVPLSAGQTFDGVLKLKNMGASATNVSASVSGTPAGLTIMSGSSNFGNIAEGSIGTGSSLFSFTIDPDILPGTVIPVNLDVSADGGFQQTIKFYVIVGTALERSFVDHNMDNRMFTISNYGVYGMANNSFFPGGGTGFIYNGGGNDMFEGGLMIATGPAQVSDGVRNLIGEPDFDFRVAPGGDLQLLQPGAMADQETYSRFDDSRAENPIGITVEQRTMMFDSPLTDNDFVIMQYILHNDNPFPINPLYVGLYIDWDIASDLNSNTGGYDTFGDYTWMAYDNASIMSNYRGVKVLQGTGSNSKTQTWVAIRYSPDDGFTEAEKYAALTANPNADTLYLATANDLNQTVSSGPLFIGALGVDTVAFAIVASATKNGFELSAAQAETIYALALDVEDEPGEILPKDFALYQNYPNPFNPSTEIAFDLPRRSDYEVSIYNMLGQRVAFFEGAASAGRRKVVWDATDFASGVYLYRVEADGFTASKKMVLLK